MALHVFIEADISRGNSLGLYAPYRWLVKIRKEALSGAPKLAGSILIYDRCEFGFLRPTHLSQSSQGNRRWQKRI